MAAPGGVTWTAYLMDKGAGVFRHFLPDGADPRYETYTLHGLRGTGRAADFIDRHHGLVGRAVLAYRRQAMEHPVRTGAISTLASTFCPPLFPVTGTVLATTLGHGIFERLLADGRFMFTGRGPRGGPYGEPRAHGGGPRIGAPELG